MESILNSIKKLLGIEAEVTSFDTDVIFHINSAFSDLHDVGVGPSEAYKITDDDNMWDEFLEGSVDYENAKEYVYLSVKLVFDPPQSSAAMASMERKLDKLEWKLKVKAESKQNGET